LEGWFLKLPLEDQELITRIHGMVTRNLYTIQKNDPHLQPPKNQDPTSPNIFYNPVRLGAAWLCAVEKQFLRGERFIFVNSAGGWMPYVERDIKATIRQNKLSWPTTYDDEIITVSRWPNAAHWYLSSNKNRLFDPGKYGTIEMARQAASAYVPPSQIHVGHNTVRGG